MLFTLVADSEGDATASSVKWLETGLFDSTRWRSRVTRWRSGSTYWMSPFSLGFFQFLIRLVAESFYLADSTLRIAFCGLLWIKIWKTIFNFRWTYRWNLLKFSETFPNRLAQLNLVVSLFLFGLRSSEDRKLTADFLVGEREEFVNGWS